MSRLTTLLQHPLLVLGVCAALFLAYATWERRGDTQHEAALLKYFQTQQALNDSTQARTAAQGAAQVAQLQGLLEAAKQLNGKLVAGVRITVPKRDTVVVHDSLPTTALPDSTRVATLHDSTFAGTVDVSVTAPPFPAALGARLTVTRPAFRPEVGFVQVGTGYVATVVWQGERYQLDAPFFTPPAAQGPKRVLPFVAGTVLTTGEVTAQAGALLRLGHLGVGPSVQANHAGAQVGVTGVWVF